MRHSSSEKPRFISEEASLVLYLREVSRTHALSIEEEAALAVRIRSGDRKALDKLVKANLRFVVSVARNYQNQGLPLGDLINEGNLGLIRAAKRFDEKKNFKFISYGVWWIRQAVLQALAEHSRIIKVPLNRVGTIHQVGKVRGRLEQRFARPPNIDEIAAEMGIDETEVQETFRIGNRSVSLDAPAQPGADATLVDLLQDEDQLRPDNSINEISLQEEVNKALGALSERERSVVRLYFGIGHETAHTLEEIAEQLQLTREGVRLIKEKAVRRLKYASRSSQLREFHE